MLSTLWAIARYTLLEYLRGRLLAVAVAVMLATLMLQAVLDALAITEARALQASVAGAFARLAMVLLLASAVIVSHVRETSDRTRDWLLALPIARHVWLFGRLLGHLAAAAGLAVLAGTAVAWAAGASDALRWSGGLALELMVCGCMACFLALTLRRLPAALLAFCGWYLLARSMAVLQLIAAAPLLRDGGWFNPFAQQVLGVLATVLPRLDLFAPGNWLEGQGQWSALGVPGLQALAYASLAVAASAIDLERSEW